MYPLAPLADKNGMPDILETLFGSKERARLLRFFLQNPDQPFDFSQIVKKNILKSSRTRSELANFLKLKFIQKKSKKGNIVYQFNSNFSFYLELKNLVSKANVYPQCQTMAKIGKLGNMKLAVISGVFLNYPKSKADMILVGEEVSKAKLRNFMSALEAEIGKEISFVLMSLEEFKYRLNMLDKFVLEFLEGPHEEVINKIPGLKQFIARRK